jgi:hypothetical protein
MPRHGVPGRTPEAWLGRRPQRSDRFSMGLRQCQLDTIRHRAVAALAPDVILANGTPAAKTMQQASHTVPVIFIAGYDPLLDGLVPSLGE